MKCGKSLLSALFSLGMMVFFLIDTCQAATTATDLHQQADLFLSHLIQQQGLLNSDYDIGNIDARLQLADCGEPLQIALFNPPAQLAGRLTLQVNCDKPSPWKIYIPVTINATKSVVVAIRPLARGDTLSATDVQLEARALASLRQNYFDNLAEVIGKTLKQSLPAGAVISATTLDNARVISKNQQVTITSGGNSSINVRASGIALSDGSLGQRIRIRNSASSKIIEATVLAPGLVSVNP